MMPPLILVVFVVLIGWPTIKLIATLVSRPRWARQRALKAQILSRESITFAEAELVETEYKDGRGSPLMLVLPPVALVGGIAAALSHGDLKFEEADHYQLGEQLYQAEIGQSPDANVRALMRDPDFKRLQHEAFELAMLRYPVCAFATGMALVPAIILFAVSSGFRASWRSFISAATAGSRQALRAFEHSFDGVYRSC